MSLPFSVTPLGLSVKYSPDIYQFVFDQPTKTYWAKYGLILCATNDHHQRQDNVIILTPAGETIILKINQIFSIKMIEDALLEVEKARLQDLAHKQSKPAEYPKITVDRCESGRLVLTIPLSYVRMLTEYKPDGFQASNGILIRISPWSGTDNRFEVRLIDRNGIAPVLNVETLGYIEDEVSYHIGKIFYTQALKEMKEYAIGRLDQEKRDTIAKDKPIFQRIEI